MNPMIRSLLLPIVIALLSFGSISCGDCVGAFGKEKVECNNGGTCNDGECDCLKGYSGVSCDSLDLCELNDVICVFGDCQDGLCECQSGYEGKLCETESRVKFLGKYRVSTEACDPLDTIAGREIEIKRDIFDASRINISDLFGYNNFPINGFFSKVEASVTPNSNSFVIFGQSPDDNSKTISGSGVIDNSDTNNIQINIDYTIVNGNKQYTCALNGKFIE